MDASKVQAMLTDALEKEGRFWKGLILSDREESDTTITYSQRQDVLSWLQKVSANFQFYPEAYALTTAILDKFLTCVTARPRYLHCMGLAAFHLATKLTEEDEMTPCLPELIKYSAARCSCDDVIRMERLMLNKLSWDVNLPTALHFTQMLHAELMMEQPGLQAGSVSPSTQMAQLTRQLQVFSESRDYSGTRPSLVAVALISLDLERTTPHWFPLTLSLLKHVNASFSELIGCRESMSYHLEECSSVAPIILSASAQHGKRKMQQVAAQDDSVDDSIKKLYNEDAPESMMVTQQMMSHEA